jgi:hypothetical protein
MPDKRSIELVFTTHSRQRMAERNFTESGVRIIVEYGEEELFPDGCKRYTLTNDVPGDLFHNIVFYYFRGKKVILTPDNVIKTVINNDIDGPDFGTYCKYVEV